MSKDILVRAVLYIIMGAAFTYFAIQSKQGMDWTGTTLIFAIIATLSLYVAIKMLRDYFKGNSKK